jgi:glycosyltransferase involved in cell wall biosynthesis
MKKKILILLTRFPYPPVDGTKSKILNNIILALKKEYEIGFCIITSEKPTERQISFFEKLGKLKFFHISKIKFYWCAIKTLFSKNPIQTGCYYFGEADEWIKRDINKYDAIYVHTIRLGRYIEELDTFLKNKILLDFNDAISLTYKNGKKYASIFWRIIYSIEQKRVLKYEMKIIKALKNFNIVSKRDKDYLLNQSDLRDENINRIIFSNIGHGVSDDLLKYTYLGKKNGLVFIGNLHYPSNFDSVEYFCENIWPPLKQKRPDLIFTVIGKGRELFKKKYPDVTFKGYVENPYPIIAEHKIFIAPIRFGAGMMTKVLDALTLGMPVITTSLCADGIIETKNDNFLIVKDADDINGWIDSINNLLDNDDLSRQIGTKAREVMIKNYLNSNIQQQFIQRFDKIISDDENKSN